MAWSMAKSTVLLVIACVRDIAAGAASRKARAKDRSTSGKVAVIISEPRMRLVSRLVKTSSTKASAKCRKSGLRS
eukprot:UN2832